MPNRQLVQCAEAVLKELRAAQLTVPTADAVRRNRPRVKLQELGQLYISVIPRGRVTELGNRSIDEITLQIDIGLQKLIGTDDENENSDPLIDLCEEIAEHFARQVLTGADEESQFACKRTVCGDEDSPFLSTEHAQNENAATGVVTLYFYTTRDVR